MSKEEFEQLVRTAIEGTIRESLGVGDDLTIGRLKLSVESEQSRASSMPSKEKNDDLVAKFAERLFILLPPRSKQPDTCPHCGKTL